MHSDATASAKCGVYESNTVAVMVDGGCVVGSQLWLRLLWLLMFCAWALSPQQLIVLQAQFVNFHRKPSLST